MLALRRLRAGLATFVLLTIPAATQAALEVSPPSKIDERFTDISTLLSRGFDIIITVSAVVFMVLLFIGGFLYLISLGNEDASKKARQLMLDAVIGLVIVAAAWAIGNYVLGLLGIEVTL